MTLSQDLPFFSAYAAFVKDEDDDNWIIRNKAGDPLYTLRHINDEYKAMEAIKVARHCEGNAFLAGLEEGKKLHLQGMVHKDMEISQLREFNDRISQQLERIIIEGSD